MNDRQVFIGNLCNVSADVLRTYCETYGPLMELSFNRDKENNIYHCFAFVTFQHSRYSSQFLANRPHFLNGEEVFVKRALPRLTSSIPERLVVTNRLIVRDCLKHEKNSIRLYFEKFGKMKKFDFDQGFIDFEDYDDVDRVLVSRPHFIRDREIHVTKYIPSEQREHSSTRSNHQRSTDFDEIKDEQVNSNRIISSDSIRTSKTRKLQSTGYGITSTNQNNSLSDEQENDHNDHHQQDKNPQTESSLFDSRYENLEQKFEEYKQSKENEISALKFDLERIKQQLNDLTQEKLDRLISNQESYHKQLMNHLVHQQETTTNRTTDDFIQMTPNKLAKKRKLITTVNNDDRNYDYYS